jgi:hypothetical protein
LNPVDEYVKFVPCDDTSPDQKWYTSQNPFDSNDRNPLTGADVGGKRPDRCHLIVNVKLLVGIPTW